MVMKVTNAYKHEIVDTRAQFQNQNVWKSNRNLARVSTISCLYMFVTFITIDIISELVKFDHYRDTRAAILDPCIQGIFLIKNVIHETEALYRADCWLKKYFLGSSFSDSTQASNWAHTSQNDAEYSNVII